jgi:acetate kinase
MSQVEQVILCINSGSSSLKFALYYLKESEELRIAHGAVEGIGLSAGQLWIRSKDNEVLVDLRREFPEHVAAAQAVSEAAQNFGFPQPAAAGHRVVHGGLRHSAAERINTSLLQELRELIPFAPLHLPSAIQGIEAVAARFPGLLQVACFDTAFHRRMPEVAQRLPLSHELWDEGVRRYGFHGLSYEYIMATLGDRALGRIVIAHLGNGASLAAVLNGRPMDTTMGFTPTGGLMMGTRCGDLDPGALLHLMREKGVDASGLDHLVNEQAGLLGVSGISSDMKILLEQRPRVSRAAQAVELFCYQLRKHIGAMAAVLGGLDMLVFTGGIGEHAAAVRWEVCRELAYLGISVDPQRNAVHADVISMPGSTCTVLVIPTNEDLMIARQTRTLLFSTPVPELANKLQ